MQAELLELSERLKAGLEKGLPGREAQFGFAPEGRAPSLIDEEKIRSARKASVMMLIGMHAESPHVLLIKRVEYPGVHSGQIGLPGGSREEIDQDDLDTALRETEEEVGLPRRDIEVLGKLSPLYIPPSNFYVQPYLGLIVGQPKFTIDPVEVQYLIQLPLSVLLDKKQHKLETHYRNGKPWKIPLIAFGEHKIWGATAMMLSELHALLSKE